MTNLAMKRAIQEVVTSMMDNVMDRVLYTDPFLVEDHRANKPLYAALVPDEIFKGSHFERRFVTPFGKVWEKLALVAAQQGLGKSIQGHTIHGLVSTERLRRIQEVLNKLEHPESGQARTKPNWQNELAYILKGKGKAIPTTVICDIYAEDLQNQQRFAFEVKAPLPNSDQTKVSKEKLLKLHAMDPCPIDGAYFALP
jgi:Type II restriction endonuclease, TdeIII